MFLSQGAIHIHSKYSDGTATIAEIAKYAKQAGLKWIVVTDHNSLKGLENGDEGWHDDVAVIVGQEVTPNDSNHFISLGLNKVIAEKLDPQEFINQTNENGGFGFIAHPTESITRKNKIRPLRWTNKQVQGFFGLEIWNHLSDWADNYNEKIGLYSLLRRESILKGPTPEVMQWWDELNNINQNIVPAIGGLDVHCLKFGFINVFPYRTSFKTLTNILILEQELSTDFLTARDQILDALKTGKNIIINRHWSKKTTGTEFYALSENKKACVGSTLKFENNFTIFIKLPKKAEIKLYQNGKFKEQVSSDKLIFKGSENGKYRFEAFINNKPWIFSNPIIVEHS